MVMITCVTFLWWDPKGRRNAQYIYTAESVNRIADQLDRHLTLPHEHVCVTDMPAGLRSDIRVAELDRSLLAPSTRFPKMQIFKPDAAEKIGKRMLFVDLDTLILKNIDHLVDRGEDVVLWANPRWGRPRATRINTSVMLYTAGTRPAVWDRFDLKEGVKRAWPKMAGTDQVWISEVLADEAKWTQKDGIYWIKETRRELPKNACIVTFAGKFHPDRPSERKAFPWIKDHVK